MGDFTNFQMHSLTPVAKVWYNFLCVKIKPTLHLSTVTKDKAILLYAMTKCFQFDIGSVIEGVDCVDLREMYRGPDPPLTDYLVIPNGQGPDVGLRGAGVVAPTHTAAQSEVRESPGDSDEETNDDAAAATPSAGDPKDDDPEVPSS